MRKSLLAAGVASFCLFAGVANAAQVVLNATADLTKALVNPGLVQAGNYFGQADALPLVPVFTVSEGDTFVYNLDFLGNQVLNVTGLSLLWPLVLMADGNGSSINMTGTLQILDIDGQVIASGTRTNDDGGIHIAQVFFAEHLNEPASFQMAGLRYEGVLNNYYGDGTSRQINGPSFMVQASAVTLAEGVPTAVPGVPEPATWALMIGGFSGAGAMLRRRRAALIQRP